MSTSSDRPAGTWDIEFIPEADLDLEKLDQGLRRQVLSAIYKTARMIAESGGHYGKPLGHQSKADLTGCYKIRVGHARVVYAKKFVDSRMIIVVIGVRDDKAVYREAAKRLSRHR